MIKIVEKKNPLAVHGLFYSMEQAERHLREIIPEYVRRGYFMDKTLTPDDFTIATNPTKDQTNELNTSNNYRAYYGNYCH